MKKRIILALCMALTLSLLTACGSKTEVAAPAPAVDAPVAEAPADANAPVEEAEAPDAEEPVVPTECPLEDGEYTALFETDSSMFHVTEAHEDKGVLTVKDGQMTIHVSLAGKGILNLYRGTAEEAQNDLENVIEHTEDEVTFSDGMTETVYGFDIPVPYLDDTFECALIGKKGTWYSHKVSVKVVE